MRIAVWYNLPSGGSKRALFDHVCGLKARGHTIEAWCTSASDRAFLPLNDIVEEHVIPVDWPKPPTLADLFLGRAGGTRLVEAMNNHCRTCANQIDSKGFDLIFVNTCMFMAAAPIACFAKTKSILYLAEPYRHFYEADPELVWLNREPGTQDRKNFGVLSRVRHQQRLRGFRIQARAEKVNVAAYRKVLVNSYFSRESNLRAYGLDSEVCYLGISPKWRELSSKKSWKERSHVVSVGSFKRKKSVEFVVLSIATMAGQRPSLIWIANDSDPSYLEEVSCLANSVGVDLVVRIRISDEEIVDVFSRSFAFVYAPILEPFGLAPIEAGACGLPVIAVKEGGVRETVEDGKTGLLVERDHTLFGKAIALLRDKPDVALLLGRYGEANAREKWSHDAAIDRLESKFRSLTLPASAALDGPDSTLFRQK